MSQFSLGRGKGRGRRPQTEYSNGHSIPLTSSANSVSPPSPSFSISDDYRFESGFCSAASDTHSSISSQTSNRNVSARGRGTHLKRNVVPADPFWTVTNLTKADFWSSDRPKKPDELGSLGQQIQAIVNYFPILQFPHKGLVYKYHIQIRNKKNSEIHRDRRRYLYRSSSFFIVSDLLFIFQSIIQLLVKRILSAISTN
jgi:hypothetical protein